MVDGPAPAPLPGGKPKVMKSKSEGGTHQHLSIKKDTICDICFFPIHCIIKHNGVHIVVIPVILRTSF